MEKINLNNISLSYETKGQGSDVLLLHGFPSNMYMWNEIKKSGEGLPWYKQSGNTIKTARF